MFAGFTNLKKIYFPKSIRQLGAKGYPVFETCSNLKEIHFAGNAPKMEDGELGTSGTVPTIYVPYKNSTWTDSLKAQNDVKWVEVGAPATDTITAVKNKITAQTTFKKTYSTKAQSIKLSATAKGGAKLSYKASDKKIKISTRGIVTIPAKYIGKFTVTVTSAATKSYQKTTKKITITVAPTKTRLSSVKNTNGAKMIVKWKKNIIGSGYQVQYSRDKNFKKGVKTVAIKKNSTISTTISKLSKGKTYYVRIRTAKGKIYSAWSAVKSVKISK